MKTTGASLIAESLRVEGVHEVFALAGDHTLPLMDIMDRQGFRFIDTRHEQGRRGHGERLGQDHW